MGKKKSKRKKNDRVAKLARENAAIIIQEMVMLKLRLGVLLDVTDAPVRVVLPRKVYDAVVECAEERGAKFFDGDYPGAEQGFVVFDVEVERATYRAGRWDV